MEKVRRDKMLVHEKVGKSRFTVFFPMVCCAGGSKSNLAKAAGAEPAGQMRDEKVRVVVARSAFPSQKGKNTSRSEHFWKLSCRKSARCFGAKHVSKSKSVKDPRSQTTFGSWDVEKVAHVQVKKWTKLTRFGPLWKLRCRKSARRCGAKHVSKSKVQKIDGFGPLLEVAMSKKCAVFWREARFQVKSVSDHFWKLRCRKSARRCGARHISKAKW